MIIIGGDIKNEGSVCCAGFLCNVSPIRINLIRHAVSPEIGIVLVLYAKQAEVLVTVSSIMGSLTT